MILVRAMGFVIALALGGLANAANTVPNGTYSGTGVWNTVSSGTPLSGTIEMTWTQNGQIGTNASTMKIGSTVVNSFSDTYKFVESPATKFTLSRLVGGSYVVIGGGSMSGDSYESIFTQDSLAAKELGYMEDSDTLVRIGSFTAADGSVTFYRATLVRQP